MQSLEFVQAPLADQVASFISDQRLFLDLEVALRSKDGQPRLMVDRIPFRNSELARLAGSIDTLDGLGALEDTLRNRGALEISTKEVDVIIGAESRPLRIIGATDPGVNEMGQAYWIRDQARIAGCWFSAYDSDRVKYEKEGQAAREVVLSLMTLMSTPSQLARFSNIIENKKDQKYLDDPANYPHIFFHGDNLNGEKTENWAHKQDAWQMLVVTFFDAVEKGFITLDDLSPDNKKFLASVLPFLDAVKFWEAEDSGSWEEIQARRSSTLSWNIAVVDKINRFASKPGFEFLKEEFQTYSKTRDADYIHKYCKIKLWHAAGVLQERLPDESPDYARAFPQYREADAALIYALMLDMPNFIASQRYPKEQGTIALGLENAILANVTRLIDPKTGGIKRYKNDSYQAGNFWTGRVQKPLSLLYSGAGGTSDFSGRGNFVSRAQIVGKQKEAAWTHPNFQLSFWAGRRFRETQNVNYLRLQREALLRGLSMITGENEVSVAPSESGLRLIKLPSFRVPECYIRMKHPFGPEHILPGPFTPLNWAVGELQSALVSWRKSLQEIQELQGRGQNILSYRH